MNNFFKFILILFSILHFSGCSENENGVIDEASIANEMSDITQVSEIVENTNAINPPQLPSVSETPAVELKP